MFGCNNCIKSPLGAQGGPSQLIHAAVDADDLSCHIRGVVPAEPRHGIGDVFGLAEPLKRSRIQARLLDFIRKPFRHLRLDEAGRDCVAADVTRTEFLRHRLRERDYAALRGRVVGLSGVPGDADDRGDGE